MEAVFGWGTGEKSVPTGKEAKNGLFAVLLSFPLPMPSPKPTPEPSEKCLFSDGECGISFILMLFLLLLLDSLLLDLVGVLLGVPDRPDRPDIAAGRGDCDWLLLCIP